MYFILLGWLIWIHCTQVYLFKNLMNMVLKLKLVPKIYIVINLIYFDLGFFRNLLFEFIAIFDFNFNFSY